MDKENESNVQTLETQDFMRIALEEADLAAKEGEVPIGACIVYQDEIIARAHNTKERTQSALAHAELEVIREASEKLHSWRLENCTLYVTLEPCPMCASAIQQARIKKVYFACKEKKMGAVISTDHFFDKVHLNHKVSWDYGLLEEEAQKILKDFFKTRRKENKNLEQKLGGRGKRRDFRQENKSKES